MGGPFDERALGKFYGAGYLVVRWAVPMSASSTVREVFEIMKARPVYHFFDGMSHTELYSSESTALRPMKASFTPNCLLLESSSVHDDRSTHVNDTSRFTLAGTFLIHCKNLTA